ncbi:MAG: alkane 1-monooxygenase [Saprospiraceae bacterium]|nr:alkane 1-monooxygenase [Saprospiraceae bacterium]
MKWTELKYLIAYTVPVAGFISVFYDGIFSWTTVIYAFVLIPFIEFFVNQSDKNISSEEEESFKSTSYFDILLYLNIPIIFSLIYCYLVVISSEPYSNTDLWGKTLSVGIILGSGINIAHELGHKSHWYQIVSSKLLLLPSLYMHFFIEHNRGHHLNIATPKDPASSRKGENVYFFWIRSVVFGYINAWSLEAKRLKKINKSVFSLHNEMIQFQIYQLLYLAIIYTVFGFTTSLFAIAIAVVGFLLLETINYIEHYGLTRKKLPNGRYEAVKVNHSWNSNHEFGRIVLYELTRHSDHHYKANRNYQILRHHDESPQLPYGYPGSMLLSFIPPLWFKIMNKELQKLDS